MNLRYELPVETTCGRRSTFRFWVLPTVHKAQGSQFDHVVLSLDRSESPGKVDYRRFVYTAVTRAARRLTVLVGDHER